MDTSSTMMFFPLITRYHERILSAPISAMFPSRNVPSRWNLQPSPAVSRGRSLETRSSVTSSADSGHRHWMVLIDRLPDGVDAIKPDVVNYYVKTLERILKSETDAQMSIYDVSQGDHFGFCCDIDEDAARELARLEGVLLVTPDPSYDSIDKDYSKMAKSVKKPYNSVDEVQPASYGAGRYWMVRIRKPGIGVITKEKIVDYCTELLSKVMGTKKDAQVCIYHVSWRSELGFCCEVDEECARELSDVPGVLSVSPDRNYGSDDKDYGGYSADVLPSRANQAIPVKTKKLFVTGLSFYTSEQTLRSAFEKFGELVEVKVIIDKISKRSKGYAFIEYTTEDAASKALKEMNGQIINGWMIVVDVAKTSPPKYSRRLSKP